MQLSLFADRVPLLHVLSMLLDAVGRWDLYDGHAPYT